MNLCKKKEMKRKFCNFYVLFINLFAQFEVQTFY